MSKWKFEGKTVQIAIASAVVLFVLIAGTAATAFSLSAKYKGVILPNTFAAGVDLGGKTHLEAAVALNSAFDAYVAQGFAFVADGTKIRIDADGIASSDATQALATLDTDATIEAALRRGHSKNAFVDAAVAFGSLFIRKDSDLKTDIDEVGFTGALKEKLAHLEQPLVEPALEWTDGRFAVTPGKKGEIFDLAAGIAAVRDRLATLSDREIVMKSHDAAPSVSDASANVAAGKAEALLLNVPLTLTSDDKSWTVATSTRAAWLTVVSENGDAILAVSKDKLKEYLGTMRAEIEVAPQDARFEITNGRASAFAESRDGISIDEDKLVAALKDDWIRGGKTSVLIPLAVQKSQVSTESVNDLGIKDVLGIGTSTFYGSHAARIKNLKNALRKLNGLLIKPDEEFSLVAALQPFTLEGGWVPEKVIKGTEIKSEIGGGACQIGTTTFRTAMNSGLPILERQNHSLVVSYYNDLNGNPGTDATIYDPSPDFRFKNDTGHYILFQTVIDEKKQSLTFTFWGTKDGRKGSYTPPLVSKWYPAGAGKTTLTTDLAPGKKDCQAAFRGADASFIYTVVKPDGTEESRVFTSHYRPLGAICMVGATAEEVAAGALNPPAGSTSSTPQ